MRSVYIISIIICISACSPKSDVFTTQGELKKIEGTPISVNDLDAKPQQFLGKKIKFYLDGVAADSLDMLTQDGFIILTSDMRLSSRGTVSFRLPNDLADKWKASKFQKDTSYTITFSGLVQEKKIGEKIYYIVAVNDFQVNWEEKYGYVRPKSSFTDNLPNEVMEVPLPTPLEDPKRLGLFPEQYKGVNLKFNVVASRDDMKSSENDMIQIELQNMVLMLRKADASKLYDQLDKFNKLQIVGKLVDGKGRDGKAVVDVRNVALIP